MPNCSPHMAFSIFFPFILLALLLVLSFAASTESRKTPRRFTNIAPTRSAGDLRHYRRTPSQSKAKWIRKLRASLTTPLPRSDTPTFPWWTGGQPGVAVGDFDGDGYDDIYVTNGPDTPNSLFLNQYPQRKKPFFRNVGRSSGAAATDQDSSGVCYGDLNRDGRNDIVVLSAYGPNKIFLSTSQPAKFVELDWADATGDRNSSSYPSSSCALGDVNGDGWLDILVANGVPREDSRACLVVPYELNKPNQLFINQGPGKRGLITFRDVSLTSGINEYGGDIPRGKYTLTWAAALVDVNLDGHLDIVQADDQCGLAPLARDPLGGADRGAIRVQLGDGKGNFKSRALVPRNPKKNNREVGDETWMALGFGDFNCDGRLDIFGSNSGDYHAARYAKFMGRELPERIGLYSSRWWLMRANGDFEDASVKETGVTVFGWGNAVCDYDNDGDQDIVMVGSLEFSAFSGSDNPNIIYKNHNCKAKFSYDLSSLQPTGTTRSYQGLAIGDFNRDGYPDVVGAAGVRTKRTNREYVASYNSTLDSTAYFTNILKPSADGSGWVWSGQKLMRGDLMVQMNRETDADHCWVSVQPVGMLDLVPQASTNRGALGATLRVTPKGLHTMTTPIVSGESFGSQHSPRRNFGLGKSCTGSVEVIWPSGVRNKLYDVKHGEVVTIPEVPCSYDGHWKSARIYRLCVAKAVGKMVLRRIVKLRFGVRLIGSAMRARSEHGFEDSKPKHVP